MATTQEIRNWWSPACNGPFTKVGLFGEGAVSVDPRIVRAVEALNGCLVAAGYRTRQADTGAYNCRKITGGSGYSLHAYGIAIDINWQSNPYGKTLVTDMPKAMVAAIKAIRTNNGKQVWRWGGDYSGNKDAMHFEIVCSPADIATGINGSSAPTNPNTGDEDMAARLARGDQTPQWWVVGSEYKRYIPTVGHAQFGASKGLWQGSAPEVWPQAFINEMPTLVTEEWIKALMGDLLNYRSTADNATIIDAINKHNPTATVSEAQIDKISASLKADLDKIAGLSEADKQAIAELTADAVVAEIAS